MASDYARRWGEDWPGYVNTQAPFNRSIPLRPAVRSAGNPNTPRSGKHTLDPGQRAARTRQTTRKTTPPVSTANPYAMSHLYGSKKRDFYGNLLMKHYGV